MKNAGFGVLLALATLPVAAKEQIIKLSQADGAALQGKTVALTVHPRPTFVAMTAGKASFGLFGVGAMAKAGNSLIDENHVEDPAGILRDGLSAGLASAYGAHVLEVDKTPTDEKKPAAIAKLHPDADYVLDVRSGGWNYAYFPTKWGSYWVGYSAQVQLIDAKTGKLVANEACNISTHDNPSPPSREQLHADGAKLLKDVVGSLGWGCMQLLAKDEFALDADKVAATPTNLIDPLSALASAAGTPAAAGAPPVAPPAAPTDAGAASPQDAQPTAPPPDATASGQGH